MNKKLMNDLLLMGLGAIMTLGAINGVFSNPLVSLMTGGVLVFLLMSKYQNVIEKIQTPPIPVHVNKTHSQLAEQILRKNPNLSSNLKLVENDSEYTEVSLREDDDYSQYDNVREIDYNRMTKTGFARQRRSLAPVVDLSNYRKLAKSGNDAS